MGSFDLSTGVLDLGAGHSDHVHTVLLGEAPPAGIEEVVTSWQRSANQHRVDPADKSAPRILTARELADRRAPLAFLIASAQEELDRLYGLVRGAGYVILLCDADGIAIDHRGEDRLSSDFRHWGTWLGGVWSEEAEGTNGIGTCIAELRAVTIHRSQHFRSRHKDLSCSGAPIFGVDARLLAVLDVSAIDPVLSESAHALTGVLTASSARNIEERLFREHFHREWIVVLAMPDSSDRAMLLAIDRNQRVLAADRMARRFLLLDERALDAGLSLWSLFERDAGLFQRKDANDFPARLVLARGDEPWPALLTPPAAAAAALPSPAAIALHARPRHDLPRLLQQIAPPPPARGGLPPRTMLRVREHVEAHLGESIDLAALASVAGVSLFHFARQFKQTAGITPHHYLVARRVERARSMLAESDLPLSEIALATGFADQSHFARHFRQMTGTTPREFRMAAR
jgi:AraC-like DNA-binding protein